MSFSSDTLLIVQFPVRERVSYVFGVYGSVLHLYRTHKSTVSFLKELFSLKWALCGVSHELHEEFQKSKRECSNVFVCQQKFTKNTMITFFEDHRSACVFREHFCGDVQYCCRADASSWSVLAFRRRKTKFKLYGMRPLENLLC